VWLASYPKSGNTWLRAFLANYLSGSITPADINDLPGGMGTVNRVQFDRIVGLESSDLTTWEIDFYRSEAFRSLAAASRFTLYVKTHEAYLTDTAGRHSIPAEITQCAVYVVRNPLDIVVSFAHHLGTSFDRTIDHMEDPHFAFGRNPERLHKQLRQPMLSWSGHAESWLGVQAFPVLMMRYEDMLSHPEEAFGACVGFLGLEFDAVRLRHAIRNASFDSLQDQERKHGFRERPTAAAVFFRSGRSGQWRERLNGDQVIRILKKHGAMMESMGYSECLP
jgi:hypothetical protein